MLPERARDIYVRFENYNYFENFEYKSPTATGYTLIGTWLRPIGEYYVNDKIRIQAGLSLLKYYGDDKFDDVSEWFSVIYQPNQHIQFLFGNLDNSSNFGLPAPMYDPVRFATTTDSKGMQLKTEYSWLKAQTWLEWGEFIHRNDNFQEVFTGGVNAELNPTDITDTFSMSLPISFLGTHHGGEIDTSEQNIETVINSSVGLKFYYKHNKWKFILTPQFLYFNEVTKNYRQPIAEGGALYIQADMFYKQLNIGIEWWTSKSFFAILGDPIYQSYSYYSPDTVYKNNNMFSTQLYWNHNISEKVSLIVGGNFIYDIDRKKNNFIAGIKLILKPEFFCHKFKRQTDIDN